MTHDAQAVERAAYEASGFVIRHMLDRAGITARRVVASGGGTHVTAWMQGVADATGLPVDTVAVAEGSALGAAYIARWTAGLESSLDGAQRWARVGRGWSPMRGGRRRPRSAMRGFLALQPRQLTIPTPPAARLGVAAVLCHAGARRWQPVTRPKSHEPALNERRVAVRATTGCFPSRPSSMPSRRGCTRPRTPGWHRSTPCGLRTARPTSSSVWCAPSSSATPRGATPRHAGGRGGCHLGGDRRQHRLDPARLRAPAGGRSTSLGSPGLGTGLVSGRRPRKAPPPRRPDRRTSLRVRRYGTFGACGLSPRRPDNT